MSSSLLCRKPKKDVFDNRASNFQLHDTAMRFIEKRDDDKKNQQEFVKKPCCLEQELSEPSSYIPIFFSEAKVKRPP